MAFRAAYMQIKQKKVGRMADIKCRRMVIPGWGEQKDGIGREHRNVGYVVTHFISMPCTWNLGHIYSLDKAKIALKKR